MTDLGVHQLRDVDEPWRLFQVGDATFAPLPVVTTAPQTNLPTRPTRLIRRVDEVARLRESLT